MPNKKHYIITAVTLGAIAATSALLIGVANLVTAKRIEKNAVEKFNKGVASIFGSGALPTVFEDLDENTGYIDKAYTVNNSESVLCGWAIYTTGSNMYGKISLIAGFDYESKVFKGVYLVSNEQTYASTLVDNYINPLNSGTVELDDVSCGATYGAKLVRDMVNAAQSYVNEK